MPNVPVDAVSPQITPDQPPFRPVYHRLRFLGRLYPAFKITITCIATSLGARTAVFPHLLRLSALGEKADGRNWQTEISSVTLTQSY